MNPRQTYAPSHFCSFFSPPLRNPQGNPNKTHATTALRPPPRYDTVSSTFTGIACAIPKLTHRCSFVGDVEPIVRGHRSSSSRPSHTAIALCFPLSSHTALFFFCFFDFNLLGFNLPQIAHSSTHCVFSLPASLNRARNPHCVGVYQLERRHRFHLSPHQLSTHCTYLRVECI